MHTLQQLRSGELSGAVRLQLRGGLTEFPREIFDLALVSERSARRTMVPPLPDGSRRDFGIEDYRMRSTSEESQLDDLAQKQLVAARPAAVIADLDSIDVWYDGAPLDPVQLDAAFALTAHLAIGNAQQAGPYR